jgi:hypothetical protein
MAGQEQAAAAVAGWQRTINAAWESQRTTLGGGGTLAAAGGVPVDISTLSPEQQANARTIIDVGRKMGLPPRAWEIAVATAMQESTLRNLDHGDRDSLGLFQQRPSQGWGTPAQVRDPVYASTKFYEGLKRVKNWESLPLTVAAQRVQRSGYPDAYAKWEPLAKSAVQKYGNG